MKFSTAFQSGFLRVLALVVAFYCQAATPSLFLRQISPTQFEVTWSVEAVGYELEESVDLTLPSPWHQVGTSPISNGGLWLVALQPDTQTRFYRLRGTVPEITTVAETSPAAGESGISVTRETIFRFNTPLAADTLLTGRELFAEFGGRQLLARPELSSDRRTATLFFLENLPASARVRVTLDGDRLRDSDGRALDAEGDGQPGGSRILEFDTAATSGLPSTAVIGRVFASERNADGSNRPLANATITVNGAEESLRATTDTTGFFKLEPAPAGRFFVHVDGRTALGSQWPDGAYYPYVGKAWEAVAGKTDNLAGGSGEIFLPLIQQDALQPVSAIVETRITFSPSVITANPTLAGVEIWVPPNALFSDNGARGGKVGIAPVPPDRLPEPLPPGLNLPLVITIQTDGGSNFDVPVPVKFPNLADPITGIKLPSGAKTALWSFNHDSGHWESQGTMTITADGQFAVTDPGVGVRQPGWHGSAPGSPGGSGPCSDCPQPKRCDGDTELKAIFTTADCATDGVLGAVIATPVLGCAVGGALNSWRFARDCLFLDLEECLPSGLNNLISTGVGCVPFVGNSLNMVMCTDATGKAIRAYQECPPTAGNRRLQEAGDDSIDPVLNAKLNEALSLLELQETVSAALRDATELILGSPVWSAVPIESANQAFTRFFESFLAALQLGSRGGIAITSEERAEMLLLPLPTGVNGSDVQALLDRFQNIDPTGLHIEPTEANLQVFNQVEAALAAAATQQWKSVFEGAIRALAILSEVFEPRSPTFYNLSSGDGIPTFPPGQHHYALVNLENGFTQRGRLNSQSSLANVILAPQTYYLISYFMGGPEADLSPSFNSPPYLGTAIFKSEAPGIQTRIPFARMLENSGEDDDQDGLSNHAEFVLGTSKYTNDGDSDGIPDGQEISSGTNPLDGVSQALGVVSSASTPNSSRDVAAGNGLAVLATYSGLVVFDVSNPQNPVQIAVVPGNARAVTLRDSLALVAFEDEVRLLDLAVPTTPQTRWVHAALSPLAVAFGKGSVAFVTVGSSLRRLDSETGAETGLIPLPTPGQSVAVRGDVVYALGGGKLTVCRDGDVLGVVATINAEGSAGAGGRPRRLSLAGPLLYAQHNFGFNVFNLADPETPNLVHDITTDAAGWRHIVPTGTGLALVAEGPNSTDDGPHDVSLYNLQPGGTNAQFITTFETPGSGEAVAIAGGHGYVADGAAGLAVVSFLAPDLAGLPPTVVLEWESPTGLPKAEGDSLFRIGASATDDVAVRHVDFFINGQWMARDDSFPFEWFYRTPLLSPSNPNFKVRLRAEDLAGNASESTELVIALVEDATPPGIVALEPPPGSIIVPAVVTEVRVAFHEPVVTPVSEATLSVLASGPDGQLDTFDDEVLSGAVQYESVSRSIVIQASSPLLAGQYRVTLAAGQADAAGNVRPKPLVWSFKTGPEPRVDSLFPPANYVQVGGTLDEITFTFDQPLPKASADTFAFQVSRRIADGPLVEVTPINVQLSPDSKTFSLRTTGSFLPGSYRVFGSGPNVQGLLWEFVFRDVPNEVVSTSIASGVGLVSNWKYFPGPGTDDELIINLPGEIAPLDIREIKSITAYSDIRFLRQVITVEEPIECFAGLEVSNTRFEPGTTHVRGPLAFYDVFGDSFTDLMSHTIHAYGGGIIRAPIRFSHPDGALVNHPGSILVLSNLFISNTGTPTANAGRIVNLGTLSSRSELVRLEDVRVRNDGRLEVTEGDLTTLSLENEGEINVTAGAKLVLARRMQGGVSSRITGAGAVEFGAFDPTRPGLNFGAEAELRGEFETTGPLTLVGGNVTFWRPLLRPGLPLAIQGGILRLLGPARLGALSLNSGELVVQNDTEIGTLVIPENGSIEVATLSRVTGEARLARATFLGLGVMEFAGLTVVTNGTQIAAVGSREGTVRNTGRWLQAAGGNQGSFIAAAGDSSSGGLGVFENAGEFEQTTARPLIIQAPFRNSGRMVLSSGPVSFDARPGFTPAHRGAYLPQPGGELVLNGTPVEHHYGVLDLTAGVLSGTGSIQGIGSDPEPKVINRAQLRPGNPTGDLTIRASDGFEQTATGELVITLAGSGNSRLVLNSTAATLAGTLRVQLAEGYLPELGQTFDVITFSSRTGEFGDVVLPGLGAGKKLEVVYGDTAVSVRVVVGL